MKLLIVIFMFLVSCSSMQQINNRYFHVDIYEPGTDRVIAQYKRVTLNEDEPCELPRVLEEMRLPRSYVMHCWVGDE